LTTKYARSSSLPPATTAAPGDWHAQASPSSRSTNPPQQHKQAKAPEGGPVYVPLDVTDPRLRETLAEAGFQPEEPTAFTVEGLTIYLTKDDVAALFTRLADLAATGGRLAVSFESGFQHQRVNRMLARAYYRRHGETWRFRLPSDDAPAFFSEAGWTLDRLLTSADMEKDYLSGTKLAGKLNTLNTSGFKVIATK
jgi:methyltransferase (TIGR00027 family)